MMKSESGSHETSLTSTMTEADRHRERLESERAREAARAEAEHRHRLAMYAAELEAKRRELAELEGAPTIERPGRQLLQWMVPAAAAVLVAIFAIMAAGTGTGNDGARQSASPDTLASHAAEVAPEPIEVAPSPEVVPEPVADTPEPEPREPAASPKTPKTPKQPKNPKNPPPLVINPTGDPLG
jgi:outer membrane biosynthesis protein TonB